MDPSTHEQNSLEGGAPGAAYVRGVWIWIAFSVLAVALRGVRWDENYEFAQVILGQIPYPEGHPLYQYTRGMYSLQTHSLAWLMYFLPGPLAANAFRNLLFMLATVIPPYLIAAHLTRRSIWGHAATLIMLMGVHVPFFSTYPIQVWPDIYSNGQVGLGYMILTVWAFAAGRFRLGGFLAGLAPAVHLGQFPPLLVFFVLFLGLHAYAGRWGAVRESVTGAALGAVLSGLFAIYVAQLAVLPPVDGPYASTIDPKAVWTGYMRHHATHRALPFGTGHIVLVAMVLFAFAIVPLTMRIGAPGKAGNSHCEEQREERAARCGNLNRVDDQSLNEVAAVARGSLAMTVCKALCNNPWFWYALYGLLIADMTWDIMLIHLAVKDRIPYVLMGWLPYRLMNHASYLLIPMLVSLFAGKRTGNQAGWLIVGALAYGLCQPLLATLLPDTLYARYFATGEAVYFALMGGGVSVLCLRLVERTRWWGYWLGLTALALAALAWRHQFGFACCLLGVMAGAILAQKRREGQISCCWVSWIRVVAALLASFTLGFFSETALLRKKTQAQSIRCALGWLGAILAVLLLAGQYAHREHLPVTKFEREVREYLAGRGAEDAMILVRHQQESYQARLHHPVMVDMCTQFMIAYRPAIAPSVYKLYKDLYGINFASGRGEKPQEGPWFEVWPAKSRAEWERLAKEYDFRYILAPAFMKLDLRPVLIGRNQNLFEVRSQ